MKINQRVTHWTDHASIYNKRIILVQHNSLSTWAGYEIPSSLLLNYFENNLVSVYDTGMTW